MKRNALLLLTFSTLICSCDKQDNNTIIAPVRVKTMCIEASDITHSNDYSGTVEASSSTTLSFPVGGTVQRVAVESGSYVAKGQLIASMDQRTLRNAYDIAKSSLDQAQDAYDRMKQLHDANSLPDMQWVDVQNTLVQARSAEAIARKSLEDANLYAPVSGYVYQKYVEPGMTVAPIEPVVKIVTINPVKVSISMPENEVASAKVGQNADVTVDALNGQTFTGKITEKGVAANPITRAYDVMVTVPNKDGKLLPGMICNVSLESENPQKVVILPISTVLLDADNSNFVWVKRDGKAVKRIVHTRGITNDGIIISSGIIPGDSIITEGIQKVSQGMAVVNI